MKLPLFYAECRHRFLIYCSRREKGRFVWTKGRAPGITLPSGGLFFKEISIQMRESALQRLKFSLDQKIQTLFIVEEAIINTRSIREMSIISCGTKLESERLTARLRLEAAADITDLDFPKEVSNSLHKAVARDVMVKDFLNTL